MGEETLSVPFQKEGEKFAQFPSRSVVVGNIITFLVSAFQGRNSSKAPQMSKSLGSAQFHSSLRALISPPPPPSQSLFPRGAENKLTGGGEGMPPWEALTKLNRPPPGGARLVVGAGTEKHLRPESPSSLLPSAAVVWQ